MYVCTAWKSTCHVYWKQAGAREASSLCAHPQRIIPPILKEMLLSYDISHTRSDRIPESNVNHVFVALWYYTRTNECGNATACSATGIYHTPGININVQNIPGILTINVWLQLQSVDIHILLSMQTNPPFSTRPPSLPPQDAGLETMALEVGTVQGGQIAALQDGKEGGMGEPYTTTAVVGLCLFHLRTSTVFRGNVAIITKYGV